MKKAMTFRLSEAARAQLAIMTERWNTSGAGVVEALLMCTSVELPVEPVRASGRAVPELPEEVDPVPAVTTTNQEPTPEEFARAKAKVSPAHGALRRSVPKPDWKD